MKIIVAESIISNFVLYIITGLVLITKWILKHLSMFYCFVLTFNDVVLEIVSVVSLSRVWRLGVSFFQCIAAVYPDAEFNKQIHSGVNETIGRDINFTGTASCVDWLLVVVGDADTNHLLVYLISKDKFIDITMKTNVMITMMTIIVDMTVKLRVTLVIESQERNHAHVKDGLFHRSVIYSIRYHSTSRMVIRYCWSLITVVKMCIIFGYILLLFIFCIWAMMIIILTTLTRRRLG